jgi:hypothetical protein
MNEAAVHIKEKISWEATGMHATQLRKALGRHAPHSARLEYWFARAKCVADGIT